MIARNLFFCRKEDPSPWEVSAESWHRRTTSAGRGRLAPGHPKLPPVFTEAEGMEAFLLPLQLLVQGLAALYYALQVGLAARRWRRGEDAKPKASKRASMDQLDAEIPAARLRQETLEPEAAADGEAWGWDDSIETTTSLSEYRCDLEEEVRQCSRELRTAWGLQRERALALQQHVAEQTREQQESQP